MAKKEMVQEIRGKDSRELQYDLEQLRKELFHARLQVPTETGRSSDIRGTRRQIARILTILKQREANEGQGTKKEQEQV